jgi:hypothetical protein
MGARSKITQLPSAVRAWLDQALAEKGFADYKLLEAELGKRGYAIGKSSIHRYGAALERRLSAIRASTEAARAIANAAPDDADMRSAAVISLVQTQTFETLVQMEEATKEEDPVARAKVLALVAKNIATLSRASVNQKKHELEVRGRAEAAAEKVTKLAKRDGASKETVDEIRREILGIAA